MQMRVMLTPLARSAINSLSADKPSKHEQDRGQQSPRDREDERERQDVSDETEKVFHRHVVIHQERQKFAENITDHEHEAQHGDREQHVHDKLAADEPVDYFHLCVSVKSFSLLKQAVTAFVCAVAASASPAIAGNDLIEKSRQCLLVVTESWTATKAMMVRFDRDSINDEWRRHPSVTKVVVGKAGLAWGERSGVLVGGRIFPERIKFEGDYRAPAGAFPLHTVFGYAPTADIKMPYQPLSPAILGIDDPQSRYYNQLVDTSKINEPDWRSFEVMRRRDDLYKWGVFVDYNVPPKRGLGSCIFMHVWRGPDQPTVGCTAMSEKDLVKIIRWLDPAKNPLLIQLPRPLYDHYRETSNLPPLP